MCGSHFDKQTQRERTCSLVHGTWRCVGGKIACAGACALMVGQLLLPSVALATECADSAAATGEVAAAPVTPTVAEDAAPPRLQPTLLRRHKLSPNLSRQSQPMPPMSLAVLRSLGKTLLATTALPRRQTMPSCPAA